MMRLRNKLAVAVLAVALTGALAACTDAAGDDRDVARAGTDMGHPTGIGSDRDGISG